jgi:serine/threonine protein phosphatase PrpC
MKFNFATFPSLRVLDVSDTQIQLPTPIPPSLGELATSDKAFLKTPPDVKIRFYSTDRVGYSEMTGSRPTMEDTLILRKNFEPGTDVYAVIDGHGGSQTAAWAAHLIPLYFGQLPEKSIGAISSVVKQVNAELKRRAVTDGAALVFTCVTPTEIGCAHLGDSRALIVKSDLSVIPLTVDHKPTERSEIDLVKENRSFVEKNRTAGILAVSRSIGDFQIKGVSRIPAMTSHPRRPDDFRLVMCCDGVFDVIRNEEIGRIVGQEDDLGKAAYLLRNLAFARGSQDNISVIVVDLTTP